MCDLRRKKHNRTDKKRNVTRVAWAGIEMEELLRECCHQTLHSIRKFLNVNLELARRSDCLSVALHFFFNRKLRQFTDCIDRVLQLKP